jgi:hypothetical protein
MNKTRQKIVAEPPLDFFIVLMKMNANLNEFMERGEASDAKDFRSKTA